MSTSTISRLQRVQIQGSVEGLDAARDAQEDAIKKQESAISKTHTKRLEEIKERAEAREAEGLGRLFGTIIGGPLIGTLIGGAIGGAIGDGSSKDATEAKKQAELASLDFDRATDDFNEAKDAFTDAKTHQDDLSKFTRELRDFNWVGTHQ